MKSLSRWLTPAVLIAVLAILSGPGAFSQGTPDGETPANEGVCDDVMADGVTKGLYGLCVAFCEAQDCEATLDEATGEVTFDESCRPSNPKILENYNKRKLDSDPPMPCVNLLPAECPCWTPDELALLADGILYGCTSTVTTGKLSGTSAGSGGAEYAVTEPHYCQYLDVEDDRRVVNRFFTITESELLECRDSIEAECAIRR